MALRAIFVKQKKMKPLSYKIRDIYIKPNSKHNG